MTRSTTVVLVLLALWALGGAASGAANGQRRAPASRRGPLPPGVDSQEPLPEPNDGMVVGPGWYWYWFRPADRELFGQWTARHRGRVFVRKAMGSGEGSDAIVILEVVAPVDWDLPGMPSPAPAGINTTLDQIEHSGSPELTRMGKFLEQLRRNTTDVLEYYDRIFQQWLDERLRQ